jgi:hypothetical protein
MLLHIVNVMETICCALTLPTATALLGAIGPRFSSGHVEATGRGSAATWQSAAAVGMRKP